MENNLPLVFSARYPGIDDKPVGSASYVARYTKVSDLGDVLLASQNRGKKTAMAGISRNTLRFLPETVCVLVIFTNFDNAQKMSSQIKIKS